MSTTNDGGPAFPASGMIGRGMTLRDYFAAKVMQAYLTGHVANFGHEPYWRPEDIADCAYEVADAMLAAREDKQEGGAA